MPDELPWDLTGVGPMTCHISGGAAWVGGRGHTFPGMDLAIGEGSVLPRIDLTCLRPHESVVDEYGFPVVDLVVIVGTPAEEPVLPARPEGAVPLWGVRVPAGVTAENGGIEANPTWPYARIDCRT